MSRLSWLVVAIAAWTPPHAGAQQLLDRVVARVDGYAITLTDVNAAIELGVVEVPAGSDRLAAGIEGLVERQLVLAEVARFAPPEPRAEEVDREVASMTARTGGRLEAVMEATGVDRARLREMARDTIRIRAYLDQRFGTTVQVSNEEVSQYYRAHPDEFVRNGEQLSFEAAEPEVRRRAAVARRAATIAQWLRDLRARAEIIRPGGS
jgi:hypothetical protein